MYFESRAMAGAELAAKLIGKYRYENTVILALDSGGVAVGYQIAIYLHAKIQQLLTEMVRINDESVNFATVLPGGVVARNPEMSNSEYDYYYSEYMGELDEMLRNAVSKINRSIGADEISPESLRGYNVILVSDGLSSGSVLDAAVTWLKPARTEKIILACPIISVKALDKAHLLMDELYILGTTPNFISTDHYYDDSAPNSAEVKQMLESVVWNWV
jgi:putative phosphoribosyl transferase